MINLAIIIPYYKIEFFEETLKSVAAQTNKNFTLYIGNDASPDDPSSLIKKYFDIKDLHYYNYKDNLGGKNLALQWERILENIEEEWFQILGDDDMISTNFVEEFYCNLDFTDSHNCSVIKYKQRWIGENNETLSDFTNYPQLSSAKDIWRSKHFDLKRSSLSEHIFKTSVFRRINFRKLPLAWYSDDLAVLEFSENNPVIFIQDASVNVRNSTVNISSKTDNDKEKQIAKVRFLEIMLNNYTDFFSKNELEMTFEKCIFLTWKFKIKSNINFLRLYLKIKPLYSIIKIPFIKYKLWLNTTKSK